MQLSALSMGLCLMQFLRLLIVIVLTVLAATVGFVFVAAIVAVLALYFLVRLIMFKFSGRKQPAPSPAGAAPRRNVASATRGDVIEVEATEVPVAPPPALEK